MALPDGITPVPLAQFANIANDANKINRESLAELPFKEAALEWLETRRPYLAPSTFRDYQIYIRTLSRHFGELRLNDITANQIRAYQRMRLATANASIINHECSLIQQMRKRLGTWGSIADDYQPLPLAKESPGRCISELEEAKFFAAAFSNPDWIVAAFVSLISINTTAGPGEILHRRIRDIDLDQRTIRISPEGAKNRGRIRVLPLNDSALWAVKSLYARALKLGATADDHYLIPFTLLNKKHDPSRPQTHYYKGFNEILTKAGLDFRPYDFRHTAITRMLEAGVPEETVIAMAGHVNREMLKTYSHIRLEAKRKAVMALAGKPPAAVAEMLARTQSKGTAGVQCENTADRTAAAARLRLVVSNRPSEDSSA